MATFLSPTLIYKFPNGGSFYISMAPGKKQPWKGWYRNMATDLREIDKFYNIRCIVCLLPDHELSLLDLNHYPQSVLLHFIRFIRFPIEDHDIPLSMEDFMKLIRTIAKKLSKGKNVLAHCSGGVGRAGTVAAALLCFRGFSPEVAIATVQRKRAKSIKRKKQQDFVRMYYHRLKNP